MTACSAAQDQATDLLVSPAGGGISPESVAENFFEDLRSALQDPSLSSEVTQSFWVERLASYFAPSERDAQSIALRASLARFARDRERLGEDEILTLELTFDRPVKVADNGQRAMVQIPNGTLHMLIIRMTERGPLTIYEQPIGLDQVIGNPGGLVPTIRISDRWFLTEG
ncbi:MAG TPA: hypothetical protein PKA05_03510 [Roseiflexaceae bacterium]|nr:hypothetical protein [Roseiflexaceae bacterium]